MRKHKSVEKVIVCEIDASNLSKIKTAPKTTKFPAGKAEEANKRDYCTLNNIEETIKL